MALFSYCKMETVVLIFMQIYSLLIGKMMKSKKRVRVFPGGKNQILADKLETQLEERERWILSLQMNRKI
jgi:hypothetical protein